MIDLEPYRIATEAGAEIAVDGTPLPDTPWHGLNIIGT